MQRRKRKKGVKKVIKEHSAPFLLVLIVISAMLVSGAFVASGIAETKGIIENEEEYNLLHLENGTVLNKSCVADKGDWIEYGERIDFGGCAGEISYLKKGRVKKIEEKTIIEKTETSDLMAFSILSFAFGLFFSYIYIILFGWWFGGVA